MFDKMIGFIGAGNMGSAMIGGILDASLANTSQIIASARSQETLDAVRTRFSIEMTRSNETVAERSDILILAVKPEGLSDVIPQIVPHLKNSCVIVSVAAGKTIASIEDMFGKSIRLVRAMPNTPALVGEAMSALCPNSLISERDLAQVQQVFNCFGKSEVVPEHMMDTVIGVSGSSPAYVYLLIEAMADAAVVEGMPRAQAYKFAAQSVYGAAKMVLKTKEHPGALKDAVCSPGGTTIEAVAALERGRFRDTVITAQRACTQKSREMSRRK